MAGGDNLGAEAEGAGIARADGIADESTAEDDDGEETGELREEDDFDTNFNKC